MRRLVLHFGMHKAGSTSIQITLVKAKIGPDWDYANFTNSNHSGIIKSAFYQDVSRLRGNRLRNIGEYESFQLKAKHRTLFESTLINCQKENLIISAEDLCCLTQDELFDLNATCLAQGFQTEAVGYLREPKSKIESGFQQRV